MKDTISIAYAPDDNYADQAAVSAVSALANCRENPVEIVILHSGLSAANIAKFEKIRDAFKCGLRLVKVEAEEFKGLPMSRWVTVQAWFRIKLPQLCPDLNKVLYLDCDTIVAADLAPLWDTNLDGKYLAAVRDVWDVEKHLERLAMKSASYFNSGVMLINCKLWREENVSEKIKEFAVKNFRKIKYCDQDTLNKIADEKKIDLPQKYNYMQTWWRNFYHEYEGEDELNYIAAEKAPVVVHYTGPKPSSKGCGHSMAGLWWKYARMSGFYPELLEKFEKSTAATPRKKCGNFLKKIFSSENEFGVKSKVKVVTVFGMKFRFTKR